MRPSLVIVFPPFLQMNPDILQAFEPMCAQKLVSQFSVESLATQRIPGIVGGLPRTGEAKLHPTMVCPGVQSFPCEFRAVGQTDRFGQPVERHCSNQNHASFLEAGQGPTTPRKSSHVSLNTHWPTNGHQVSRIPLPRGPIPPCIANTIECREAGKQGESDGTGGTGCDRPRRVLRRWLDAGERRSRRRALAREKQRRGAG